MSSCRPTDTNESESGLVWIRTIDLRPAPQNEQLYRPVRDDDPEIQALAASIQEHGLKTPLVVSRDRFVISGHRRRMAAFVAGARALSCLVEDIRLDDPRFVVLLRECNRQRDKSFDETVREQVIDAMADTKLAYQALMGYRANKSVVKVGQAIQVKKGKGRFDISDGKQEMLEAIKKIVFEQKRHWPLSDRSIHYDLLNNPPLKHTTSKKKERYKNDRNSYSNLTDMLTRMRTEGHIPFEAIADPTRTVNEWSNTHRSVGTFIGGELENFLQGYWRDLQQSQPNHIEIVGEKNTIASSIHHVAARYCIPYTISRGYCSITPRYAIAQRFKASGKNRLILLFMSDFDPEGEDIASSFVASMGEDFGLHGIVAKKVCLTYEQAVERNLPRTYEIKKTSSRYEAHAKQYGDRAHELESLSADERSRLLSEAIEGVMDIDAFNKECEAEEQDAARLAGYRKAALPLLQDLARAQESAEPKETT